MPSDLYRIELSASAERDFDEIVAWTIRAFGDDAASRYSDLIAQALEDLQGDPHRTGPQTPVGMPEGVRTYHLIFSRERARSELGIVRKPRHRVVFRLKASVVHVLRILHDEQELSRHVTDID